MKDPVINDIEIDQTDISEEVYLFPASFGQKRFWFLDQFEPGSPWYNIPSAFRLKGNFNVEVFRKAVQTIVDRHEILRTVFEAQDGEPVQVVFPKWKLEIPLIDLTKLDDAKKEKEITRLATEEARKPFDLAKGPLTRISILKAAANDHVVLLTMHHIISDGWSMGILISEITTLYGAFLEGKPSSLPELPIQYGDFAEWQTEYLRGETLQKQLEFWKKQIGSNPPVLELPYDRPRPLVQTNAGATTSLILPKRLAGRLQQLSHQQGGTIFMTLLAAFKVLLGRYAGQFDVSVGAPIANRTRKEIESLIGLFINTLVLRTRFDDNPTFRQLLKRERDITLNAYANQDIPFEFLVDQLQPERDMSYPPLFQVMFILQNAPVNIQKINSDLTMQMIPVEMGTATFDLTLALAEGNQGISVSAEFNTDLFNKSTVDRMLQHFQNILENIVSDPDLPVAEIPLLSAEEERQILLGWNDTYRERDHTLCIHHLFEKQVKETPRATAVVFLDNTLTYDTLNKRANQLARYLQLRQVGPEVAVGIMAEKSTDLLVAVLGVLKAGGAYLPLDPGYPEERLHYMLDDAHVSILITQQDLPFDRSTFSGEVILLDRDWPKIAAQDDSHVTSSVSPENLCYLIYTSGSTGKSKGTMVRHGGLVNIYLAWEESYELRSRARNHLQMASFSFDVFAGDWTRALCSGGKLVMVPRDMLLEAEQLYHYMVREEVNIAEFVPAVLRNLTQYIEENGKTLDFFRNLIAGSDIWYVGEYKAFKNLTGSDTRLINSFGLTEATIDSCWFESAELNMPSDRLVPIGKPFSNITLYILDEFLQPVPPGVRGELFVGGQSLARGYLNRTDLTAERFIPNPFSNIAGERMYRTGDLARYLPDGNIEFLGRADTQVKLRGFRIELGEIETALSEHSAIGEAVVMLREDKPGDKRLIAYYVPAPRKTVSGGELKSFLSERLPDYMVPSAFIPMESIPLTPNGKVDRRALPKPDQDVLMKELEAEYVEPRTPTERVVASVFAKILNVEKIGATHNFFDLGGHSLLATQLVSRLKDTFKVEIPLRTVFENPAVAGIAHAIDLALASNQTLQAPPIRPVSRNRVMPLSFAQQRLWFLDRLEPNSPFYNIPENYRIRGALKPDILQSSINEIIRRHEILRTTFHTVEGQPELKIEEQFEYTIPLTDLTHLPMARREEEALRIVKEHALQPIPLDRLPLFHLELIRLTPNEHIVSLVMHHIISDNWSTNVLMREISIIYDAFSRGDASPLPPLPVQYADYAFWQRNWLKDEVLEEQLQFWKKTLTDSPPVIQLPTDHPRPAVQTYNGAYKTIRLSPRVSKAIRTFTAEEGATLFMTLLAAFATLLYRYSGQDDINIGSPIANRTHPEIEGLIGFFVNTLVLRTRLDGNPTFRELVHRVRENALQAYAHQDLPFEQIVDAVQPERNMSHSPLFQVMFALQSGQASEPTSLGRSELSLTPIEAHSATAKFDLTLFMLEEGDHLSGALEYNTDLFEEQTIQRLLDHFEQLLLSVTKNPDLPVAHIPLLLAKEQQQLLVEWNGPKTEGRFTESIIKIFEQQALRNPQAVAVQFGSRQLSYEQLNQNANRLARYLLQQGIQTESRIGICIRRSPEMIIAMLGILKAGAAYVPIDPSYPEERIRYIISDSGLGLILTEESLADRLSPYPCSLFFLDGNNSHLNEWPQENPQVAIPGRQLAYMIYTSGSTGRPKGTLITHEGLLNYLNWTDQAYPLQEGSGSLVHSTIAFDATVTAVFTPLLHGKTIILTPDEDDLEALANALQTYRDFSIVKITPAHLDLLAAQIKPQEAQGLTHAFIIGGENLTADQIRFWQKNAPDTLLFNEYGPTETVVGCVVFEAHQWKGKGSVPIGRAIPNTSVYVLDPFLQPVPVGVYGELYISGTGVARGYLNRPDLTAERFLPDPFSTLPGRRMYKTGDLVRYLHDGQMEFIGRMDTQIKIRGYRIELGEIEALLLEYPAVADAVVIVREDHPGEQRITAYLVENKEQPLSIADLKNFLKQHLPEYMIPSAYVPLETLPLTNHGKIDRKALPKPDISSIKPEAEYTAPAGEAEKQMAAIWSELLHVEPIGIHDNFFEIGGHSLLATRLMSLIYDQFNVELPLRTLFESPTIATLLLQIEKAQQQGATRSLPPLVPIPRDKDLPLSFAQQRLWFLDQLMPNSAFYNIPAAVRLHGPLNIPVLKQAINEIVRRHEVLRTIFKAVNGLPRQVVRPDLEIELPFTDLSSLQSDEKEAEIRRLASLEARRPFRLDQGPLFRVRLLKADEKDHIILFNMHHIISDGWSSHILMQEIAVLYQSFGKGEPSPLPALPVQYADFAAWQRSWLKDEILEQQLNYWKKHLGLNPPPLELPTDFQRPPVQTFNGDVIQGRFDRELSRALIRLGQQQGATLFMTLLAAFQAFLHRYTHQNEIIVGSPIAGRTRSETEKLIGFFVNTLVLKAEFDDDPGFSTLLGRVKNFTLGAYAHQDIPFEQLVDELQPERDPSHSPLFQVMFVLQNQQSARAATDLTTADLRMEALTADSGTAKFDLSLMILDDAEGFWAEFEYNTDLFRRETIEAMLLYFRQFLQSVVENPEKPVSRQKLIDPTEQPEWLSLLDFRQAPLNEPAVIHRWFEQQVRHSPQATAVVYHDQKLTFDELNRLANRLAHQLIAEGVRPETIVGISLHPSLEMVVALLAVLKAGGVYLPIDPAYPEERIRYMIGDSGIRLLLTQQSLSAGFKKNGLRVIVIDRQLQNDLPDTNPGVAVMPEHLAYMIYTSGSTGQPKGTMLQHQGLCNLTRFQIKDFQLSAQSRVLQFASFSFDASVSEIFTTLISGATLVLADRRTLLPGPDLVRLLKKQRITTITLPPSVSALLMQETFPDLQTLISAGEACPPDVANHWQEKQRFINAYGPTENTVCASSLVVPDRIRSARVPIGRAIDNVRLYILDEAGNLLPSGIPGELYIAGMSLARGYFNRPALTAEKFIPDPFATNPGSRMYGSGDLARYLSDGNIEFLGRIDQQVKVRGFRIELGEIENTLLSHPAVYQTTVMLREDIPGSPSLVAYYVGRQDSAIEKEELQNYLKQRLPGYMIPAALIQLTEIPLTPNGKIDYRALPGPDYEAIRTDEVFIKPRSAEEELLAGLFAEILKVGRISVTRSFFSLGGHSLLATQLVSRIRDVFDVELPLMKVFEAPTVAQLITAIEEERLKNKKHRLPPLKSIDRSNDLPLSFAQQRLWFLDQLTPDNATYNIPTALKFIGKFNWEAFGQSLNYLIDRHETLRTVFIHKNGTPLQLIKPEWPMVPEIIDLTSLPSEQRNNEARRLASEDAMEPFDLEIGPLLRTKILKLAEDEHVILFNMHHIISDGWSVSILIREFTLLYESFGKGQSPALPRLPIQYADFAYWQRQWLNGEILQEQIDFWKETIGVNPEPLQLPTDFQRPPVQTFNGSSISKTYPLPMLERLTEISREHGVTLFMTILAAFQTLLYRYSGQETILVGSPIANRTRSELENLIGFFVNNLVLKADFSRAPDFVTLLKQVRDHTLQAYAHQDLPFENLVEILQPERNMSHAPIFQVMFVMQNTPMESMSLSDVRLKPVEAEQKIAKYDLSLIVMETPRGLFTEFEYNTDLFHRETIERLHDHFYKLLEILTKQPNKKLSQISFLGKEEQTLLLNKWNDTQTEFPDGHCIHQLFEKQVPKFPDKIAVVFGKQSLTFRQLNETANRVARYLKQADIGPETVVGISLNRSLNMIVGILAVLKAGGAYLPIDPDYPPERIRYMIEDSGIPLLLTEQAVKEGLPSDGFRILCMEDILNRSRSFEGTNLPLQCESRNLAYIIYTSGSTGKPKGTLLTHRGLCNLTLSLGKRYRVTPQSRSLQFASFGFDASVEEIFTSLLNGATLFLVKKDILLSGTGLVEFLKTQKITNVTLPPSVLSIIRSTDFPHLQNVISAGEACPIEVANDWARKRHFVNGYGPTENTVATTSYEVQQKITGSTVPIGRPLENVQIYILDPWMNPQPIGVAGELYVSGVQLARGYLNRPDLTADRFVANPFASEPGQRMYRTGDLARYLADGNVEFLGRVDQQVKIRGFRIELGEIETVLSGQTDILDAVVKPVTAPSGDTRLAAYLIPETGKSIDTDHLKDTLKSRLPEYMIPEAFTFLDSFPLTPNGKVNYRALPDPVFSATGEQKESVKPQTVLEVRLADIWKEVLGRQQIGTTDNFFDLGGHSLLAMKLLTAIEQQMGHDINLVNFFQDPTIAHMARIIEEDAQFESGAMLIRLRKGSDRQPLFFVHPSGGSVHHYSELSKLLRTDRAVYGIQAQGLDGKMELHKSIEDMAGAYIRTIREKQAHGPYLLASWSLGVIIVHEMARQLLHLGERVDLLMQFDQGPFVHHEKPKDTAEMLTTMFKRYFKVDTEYLRTLAEDDQYRYVIKKAKKYKAIPRFVRLADFKRYIVVNETQIQAWLNYKAKPYAGKIVLFKSEENAGAPQTDLGWSKLVSGVQIIETPGDHISMLLQPNVSTLAEKISILLENIKGSSD